MRSPRTLVHLAACVVLGCLAVGACSADPEPPDAQASSAGAEPQVLTEPDLSCDLDRASPEASSINENVGGLQTDDYVVRLSQTTRLGIVALVEGDVEAAFAQLSSDYGVAVVALIEDDGDAGAITGFQQVRDLVAATCGATTSGP